MDDPLNLLEPGMKSTGYDPIDVPPGMKITGPIREQVQIKLI